MLKNIRQSENHATPAYQWLGQQDYVAFLQQMNSHAQAVALHQQPEVIWFCEHHPVYTTGKRGINNSIHALKAPLIITERGGETTYHGTGQLMMYPILNLRQRQLSVRDYVYMLEQSCIDLLADHGIQAARDCGLPGVWVGQEKIAALGIRVSQGIASHGIALNVHTDLTWFDHINPCGTSRKATSMQAQQENSPPLPNLDILAQSWNSCFTTHLQQTRK